MIALVKASKTKERTASPKATPAGVDEEAAWPTPQDSRKWGMASEGGDYPAMHARKRHKLIVGGRFVDSTYMQPQAMPIVLS